MSGIAHRDMQFVGGYDSKLWVTELPPELVTDNGYLNGIRRFRRILYSVNYARRRRKQDDDDQNRDYCPCQFDLRASIDLGRFAVRPRLPAAEF